MDREAPSSSFPGSAAKDALRFAAPVALAWLPLFLWFAAFKPGIMSADSLVTWSQATESGWVDFHPPPYTAAMWVSATLVDSPALLTLAQSMLLALSIVALARAVIRLGALRTLVVIVTGLVCLSPAVGSMAVALWKDVPYTAMVLLLAARTVDLVRGRLLRDVDVQRKALLWMCPAAAGAAALRQNGVVIVAVLVVALLVVCRDRWRLIGAVAASSLVTLGVLKLVVYPVTGIDDPAPRWAIGTVVGDIAAVVHHDPGSIRADERRLIEAVAPLESWSQEFSKFGCDNLNWQHDYETFRWDVVNADVDAYRRLAIDLVLRDPGQAVGNHLCQGGVAWKPTDPEILYTVSRGVDENSFGLKTAPLSPTLNDVALDLVDASTRSRVRWFIWRAPAWIYLAFIAIAVAAWRARRPVLLLLGLPLLAQQLSVLAFNYAQDARYMFAALVAAPILATVVFATRPDDTDSAERDDRQSLLLAYADGEQTSEDPLADQIAHKAPA